MSDSATASSPHFVSGFPNCGTVQQTNSGQWARAVAMAVAMAVAVAGAGWRWRWRWRGDGGGGGVSVAGWRWRWRSSPLLAMVIVVAAVTLAVVLPLGGGLRFLPRLMMVFNPNDGFSPFCYYCRSGDNYWIVLLLLTGRCCSCSCFCSVADFGCGHLEGPAPRLIGSERPHAHHLGIPCTSSQPDWYLPGGTLMLVFPMMTDVGPCLVCTSSCQVDHYPISGLDMRHEV